MMTLTVNGEPSSVPKGTSVTGLLDSMKTGSDRVAVVVNEDVVARANWTSHELEEGARVEVLAFAGGG